MAGAGCTTEETHEIHLLLLGKTGVGKSATGNTILGLERFKVSGRGKSETADIMQAWTKTDRYTVKVIDGPGLEETQISQVESIERAIENLHKALMECDNGVNAFVYVIKYGDQFKKEDRDAVEHLKQIIGANMGDFSVVVLTRGEEWQEDNGSYPLEQWCKDNDEHYNGLFSFCGYRCILFENRKPSADQRAKQVNELLANVNKITMDRGFYTNHMFQETSKERDKMIATLKAQILKQTFQKNISLLSASMRNIATLKSNKDKLIALNETVEKASALLTDIEKEDKGSGALKDLKKTVHEIIKAQKNSREDCMKTLATEIKTIRRASTLQGRHLIAGKVILQAAAVGATGGLAFPALLTASDTSVGASLGLGLFQSKKDDDDFRTLKQITDIESTRESKMANVEGKRELKILLLGKTGAGKSTSGNTIAARTVFKKSGQAASVTDDIQAAWTETDRYIVQLIDGPGLEDTNMSDLEGKERAITNIQTALMECDNGVNAFVFVIKYSECFTQQDRKAVENLKKIMGDNMGEYTVVLLTRGDEWIEENEGEQFHQWCKDNDKAYNGIFGFCGYRCVLFENRRPSDQLKATQVNVLLRNVEQIANKRGFYTNKLFQEGAANREKMIVHLKAPQLKIKYKKCIDLLSGELNKIKIMESNEDKIKSFREVGSKAGSLLILMEMEDKDSGALDDLKQKVKEIIKAAEECNETCLKRLATGIEARSAIRWRMLAAARAVLSAGAVVTAKTATVATGGIALPLLVAAAYSGPAKTHKNDTSTLEEKINLLSN